MHNLCATIRAVHKNHLLSVLVIASTEIVEITCSWAEITLTKAKREAIASL